ncbi:MAG: hypothetical protein V3S26_04285 [Acidimicrobiia bacterium]
MDLGAVCTSWLASCHFDVLREIKTWERPDGQAVARVYPTNTYETLLLHGYTVDVWMQPGVKRDELSEQTARFYRSPDHQGKVALVLGAGNISSIVPLDILYKMYADGEVVIVKMNPVNDYLGPIFERIFAPMIEAGFVRFAYGASDVGAYLTGHDGVDTIHITGSSRTHDTIVFGSGRREHRGRQTTSRVSSSRSHQSLGASARPSSFPDPGPKPTLPTRRNTWRHKSCTTADSTASPLKYSCCLQIGSRVMRWSMQ